MKKNINSVNNNLDQLIREIFDLPQDYVLHDSMGPGTIPGWDSLGMINLINSLQEQFYIELSLLEIAGISSIKDLSNLLESKDASAKKRNE